MKIILKYIIFMENLICVFRNYTSYKSCGRKLIIIWIFLEIIIQTFSITMFAKHRTLYPITPEGIYTFSVTSFSIGLIPSVIYHAERFHQLLSNCSNYCTVLQDAIYLNNLRRLQKTWSIIGAVFFSIKLFVFLPIQILYNVETRDQHLFIVITNQLTTSVSNTRYVFEYFLLFCILSVISEQLDAVARSIENRMGNMNLDVPRVGENIIAVYRDQVKCFDNWMQAYRNIKDSSDLCNAIFKVQLSTMLLIVTTYFIILLYSITKTGLEGRFTGIRLVWGTFSMAVFLSTLFLISRAGQKVHNSSAALRLKLCQLYVRSLENQPFSRSTRDLLRFTSTRPICIRVFGSLKVNMALIPFCVGLFTTYTVIALQMNTVL